MQPTVPVEFQNWCQWYLKKHFEPKRKPELKCEGKDKASVGQGQDKDWKAIRKEMKVEALARMLFSNYFFCLILKLYGIIT